MFLMSLLSWTKYRDIKKGRFSRDVEQKSMISMIPKQMP
jgi:hypothetical protein